MENLFVILFRSYPKSPGRWDIEIADMFVLPIEEVANSRAKVRWFLTLGLEFLYLWIQI
jgi:hypothetical protein